ncbi:F-box and WD repeat domain containing protein 10B [Pezoporus wallicus]|uniref:F-box and WD repeat domain containing protein 10B n=1 Tax=Pezoporus wallicus TaxID=35540 RepID=UPI00254DC2D4|nr:F-box and WD repeat domain containing protein 10B [Pezoporus wallicus]XP_061311535.1 F-box and WD repeat domain containing protein 10B [Pezoporus flaviventris]XP_061311536.1 F-box and WD repeat domain containing protein 10B [Pezoporus flaviventris]
MVPRSLHLPSSVNPPKDLIRCLPPHLSTYILGLLDQKSLTSCAAVSRCWEHLAAQVKKERACHSVIQENIVYLQGLCPRGAVSNYAKIVKVAIPQLNEEGDVIEAKSAGRQSKMKEKGSNLQETYNGLKTDTIQLEERNVFCGSYNIRILMDQSDQSRVIHYSGGNLVAVASADRKVRFLGMPGIKELPPLLSGHAGTIKALYLNEEKGFLLSASFDLSIRCWNLYSGTCVKTFNGHCGTITCLDLHEEQFVSGAKDAMVKVWSLESGKCLKTLKHNSAVGVVKMNGTHIVSGSDQGLVKVWSADTGALIKILEGHQGPVKCLSFDQWHLVTGSTDGYVLGWSMLGKLKRCLVAFRHPNEVLSLEFLYLRVLSGCADGKIRIFNYLTGICLKVLVANTKGDPISSFCIGGNRMVINSSSNLLLLEFEETRWDYTLDADRKVVGKKKQDKGTSRRKSVQRGRHRSVSQQHRPSWERTDLDLHYFQPPKSSGTSPTPWYELMTPAAHQQQQPFHIQAEQQKKLFISCTTEALEKSERQYSARILADDDGKAEHASDKAEATLQHERKRDSRRTMSLDKFLLRVSMLQNTCKPALDSSSTENDVKVREAWEPPLEHQYHAKVQKDKTPLPHKRDQTVLLQRARQHSDSLTVRTVSVPFETKMLQLKLKNSLYGPTVNSSIPAPSVVRPKTRDLLQEKKAHSGGGKAISSAKEEVHVASPFAASSQLIKSTRVIIEQMKNEAFPMRRKSFCPYAASSSQSDGEFRLLTGKQKEVYEAAAVAQYQAHQEKLREEQQRACKKAWLRKIKGLPIDYFTGEGKIPAPELGFNTFL